ncbi:glycosyltransferase [Rhodococcus hoagii]|nr:glycosyltransferase [Prescottella equi]
MFRANAKDPIKRSDAADQSTIQPPLSAHDRTAVIIPARNAVGLIEECLESVVPQLRDEDVVYVIDDASTDGTGDVARSRGAHVIRNDVARGPYEARNMAARIADVAHLVFFDVRCRAEDGWLDTHRKILSEGTNALSYSNVEVVKGRRLATRIAAAWRPFSIEKLSKWWLSSVFSNMQSRRFQRRIQRCGRILSSPKWRRRRLVLEGAGVETGRSWV